MKDNTLYDAIGILLFGGKRTTGGFSKDAEAESWFVGAASLSIRLAKVFLALDGISHHLQERSQIIVGGEKFLELLSTEINSNDLSSFTHRLASWLPSGRTHFAVLVGELEGLNQSQHLVHGASNGQVIHGDVSQDSLFGNDEQATSGDASIRAFFDQDTIISRDFLGDVGNQWDFHGAETAILARSLDPLEVGELGVDRHSNDFAVDFAELVAAFRKVDDFSGAHKGEVEGVEEEHQVLA